MKEITINTADSAEIKRRLSVIKKYGELTEAVLNAELDMNALLDDAAGGIEAIEEVSEESTEATEVEQPSTPAELVELAHKNGISGMEVIKEIADEDDSLFFKLEKGFEGSLEGHDKQEVSDFLSRKLTEYLEGENGSSEESLGQEGIDTNDPDEAPSLAAEKVPSEVKEEMEDVGTSNYPEGVTRDWDGVDPEVRKDQTIEFFRSNPDEWLYPEDFVEYAGDLEGNGGSKPRTVASSALRNAYKREYIDLVRERETNENNRAVYKYKFPKEEEAENEGTEQVVTKGTQRHETLALLSQMCKNTDEAFHSISELEENGRLPKKTYSACLSPMKEMNLVTHDEQNREWGLTDLGLEQLELIGGFQIN